MCIRDRPTTADGDAMYTPRAYSRQTAALSPPAQRAVYGNTQTVSYTHLDVYKRQTLDYVEVDGLKITYDDFAQYTSCLLYTSRCV